MTAAGYPAKADMAQVNYEPMVASCSPSWCIYVTMVYGPIAAWLVELFPTRIRYTSMSLPYHIGNGWFGGFLPTISFAMVAATGDIYYGLWYPIVIALMTAVHRHCSSCPRPRTATSTTRLAGWPASNIRPRHSSRSELCPAAPYRLPSRVKDPGRARAACPAPSFHRPAAPGDGPASNGACRPQRPGNGRTSVTVQGASIATWVATVPQDPAQRDVPRRRADHDVIDAVLRARRSRSASAGSVASSTWKEA